MAFSDKKEWVLFVFFVTTLSKQLMFSKNNIETLYRPYSSCLINRHWYLHKHFGSWNLSQYQIIQNTFPIDTESRNYVREVKNSLFSYVDPKPLKGDPKLAAISDEVLKYILDMDPAISSSKDFLHFVGGNTVRKGTRPIAHRYGGHQFGYWSGQLGDGRAVMLGEYVNSLGERWELQLKGSGLTPYSRRGDGRAVIRSSVREFLCSEALHALGVPTSRAASIVVSQDPVIRDQFYDGNVQKERAAVVLRLAKSWFRIGSLEILSKNNEIHLLKKLVDFIIVQYFPSVNCSSSDKYLEFFQEVCLQTADMIAKWQSIGFTHGVCNTDNFSILSITIDYGPFGFMEGYDPKFVPNTSDEEWRYRYEAQPEIGIFNLQKLAESLSTLLDQKQKQQVKPIIKGYSDRYKFRFMELFLQKLGLRKYEHLNDNDEQMIAIMLKMMEDTKADFTMTFRELSDLNLEDFIKYTQDKKTFPNIWALNDLKNHEWFSDWVKVYIKRFKQEEITDMTRQTIMKNVNPRYILRNWIAQMVIAQAERDEFELLSEVLQILQHPYTYSKQAEDLGFTSPPPSWAKDLQVSCSS